MIELLASYVGKKILVTGASGYLATNLVQFLAGCECTIIRSSRNAASLAPVHAKARVLDMAGILSQVATWESTLEGVDFVFHFSAQTSLRVAEENPSADWQTNVVPMIHLVETCRRKQWKPVVLFAGTVTEMGVPVSLPVTEAAPDQPSSIYDLHKWMAERYLCYFVEQGHVRGTTLRLANVYGPGPKSSSADRGILNLMVRRALEGKPITVYGDGNYMRDYIYVEDVVHAFLEAGKHAADLNERCFVIGSGKGCTIDHALHLVADRVAAKTGTRVPVTHVKPPRPLDPIETRNTVTDPSRFIRATGWQATRSLSDGIDLTIEFFIKGDA